MNANIKIIDLGKNEIDNSPKCVSLGNFDGIHIGHQKLMKTNITLSNKENLTPAVLLFKENSKMILSDETDYIANLDDKIEFLSDMGIDTFCLIDFTDAFRSLSPEEFISKILVDKLNAKAVVVGIDYKFGKYAAGNVDTLKSLEEKYAYKTHVVDFEVDGDYKISSRTIREDIRKGKINLANKYLGRPYKIKGKVIHGYKRGRKLNFPTANLATDFSYVIPIDGVYLTRVTIDDDKYFALTNIGKNPTFENQERRIETYILDFNKDIYGREISIEFLEFFRGDFKFNSVDELIEQMEMDKKLAYEVIENKYL